ncbi:hypothetical protein SCOR_12335 [Sulfidibacter corallicola]|uniref:Uncharacterized protein n=1 Tax=Sulfidibacter corallicola TaxID=2818388 RepID=A0A8A4TGG5_SULCO|nr:hypothetical protein [Sulfidibacter corallicola]QTD47881.1 hypothetical protein J3U87_20035 [Sulfidibacter corallicola]
MNATDPEIEKITTLQAVRQAIRSRNLRRLNEAFERPWAKEMLREAAKKRSDSGHYTVYQMALKSMAKEERLRAFQWTWDCYHPLMSDLGKCLQDMDGYVRHA